MANDPGAPNPGGTPADAPALASASYEIIRQRLTKQSDELAQRTALLDTRRREVFGSVESKLLQADRITTAHNCVPRDMVRLGQNRFLFGFNVHFGLKKATNLEDVFGIFLRDEASGNFREADLSPINDPRFLTDFQRIYSVYEKTAFTKFSLIGNQLFFVFQTGAGITDLAVFKWILDGDNLQYVDGRSEAEFRRIGFPPAHPFQWTVPSREAFRYGDHPHISIAERLFVECVGGTLTLKIEDNTSVGEGIYDEPVDDKRQKVDDADISFAIVGHLILLKIRPYKETAYRYLIFNEKTKSAVRVDSIGQSCALLPEDHGLVFPDGYYLATGEWKTFGSAPGDHLLERIIHSPNGEDSLFVFYSRSSGEYVLMPYRLIPQKIEERISCHGFSLFPNGHLVLFRADSEPQKHHSIQLRQTSFHEAGFEPPGQRESFLYQVGNRDVVRCLAESNEILSLARRDPPYPELYTDLVARCGRVLDGYPWLSSPDVAGVAAALRGVQEAANQAVDEFDKVQRLQREAANQLADIRKKTAERFDDIRRATFRTLDDYVRNLAALRALTGSLITLREVRYLDVTAVAALETETAAETERLAGACVDFLLKPEALDPYRAKANEHLAAAETITRVADAKKLEGAISQTGTELEMLIEIVNNLKIDDATETTRIIDSITAIYTALNQAKGALKNRQRSLAATEGAAQFAAQMKLLGQSAASYLDLCDSPAKCEEYLNRISVQIEELEGTFADFDEYIVQISDRRTELYEAFEQRKLSLIEARNRRTAALVTAADRILKVVANRLNAFKTVEEIHAYLAADVMIGKVRETVEQLLALEDSVKADELATRLKSLGQEAVRQLKDRQDLFTGGPGVIQLGRHAFNVNTQPLDLTVVNREGEQFIHLTGTRYFDPITDPEFLATRAVWDQEFVSENREVYRAETLALRFLEHLESSQSPTLTEVAAMGAESRLPLLQEFMTSRYQEGYTRGIHDLDGNLIFAALASAHLALGLARFRPSARAAAALYWIEFCPPETRELWLAKLRGFAERNRVFSGDPAQPNYIQALAELLKAFAAETQLFPLELMPEAAEYLFRELTSSETFTGSREGDELTNGFQQHLVTKGGEQTFRSAVEKLSGHPISRFELIRDWLRGYRLLRPELARYLDEAAVRIFGGERLTVQVVSAPTMLELSGFKGTHPRIENGVYRFDYLDLRERLDRFTRDIVPQFLQYHSRKQALLDQERRRLRLDEFKPRVLTSFVRNQLIDQVYLPLVGDNLAKQIGTAGDSKRTDRNGLLLLVSPPGYGKTTLLEYVASRLGIIFVKINGPAIGAETTSLDPEEAPNAAAREEIQKLNLSLEMGDNVMICVDDIQHCNPEFLQKFISLCDAQRKIEGVWRGQPRTYDLRGRKVVVVMAGNPYTETGQKFRLPDMLANRADTYNLGDIIGGNAEGFKASYLENAITSNAVLAPLANRNQADVQTFIRLAQAQTAEPPTFEGSYSAQETEEILAVLRKLVTVREVILAVNLEYIRSAAQADEFRTEPAFKLQGSYRNMNRLAEKVVGMMNDAEVRALILDHYRNESQTLTRDAEANLLKLRELVGALTPEETERWAEIKRTFQRNQLTRGTDGTDAAGRIVGQLAAFGAGLEAIQQTLAAGLERPIKSTDRDGQLRSLMHELEMTHATLASLRDIAIQQRDNLQGAREKLAALGKKDVLEFQVTDEMLQNEREFLDRFQEAMSRVRPPQEDPPSENR